MCASGRPGTLRCMAEHIPVAPTGEYASIDTADQQAAFAALAGPEPAWAIRAVLDAPERFAPPVLYALGTVLFAADPERGAFWFYAAQVRTRFDVNRCADPTASGAAAILAAHHGPPINRWAFADPARMRAIVERAVEWDRATPHDYDHRWVNLHGMGAFLVDGSPLSRPSSEWDAIAERTRADYLTGLATALDRPPGVG